LENNIKNSNPFLPLFFALVLIIGIFVGIRLNRNSQQNQLLQLFSNEKNNTNKLDELLDYVLREYVDTLNRDSLTDVTIETLLGNLDPHSAYIPASDLQATNEPLNGNFEGIGIEFNLLRDTIYVVTAIPGGPSEKAGIKSGDKIIFVDGKNVAGVKITNEMVFKNLKGKGGTVVKIGVLRYGTSTIEYFKITRGKIPIYSIDAAYMMDSITGFIKISRFASTTYQEFDNALSKLENQGLKQLILDLRGNPGGFLDAAIDISDEFLPKGKMIVYTQGKNKPRQNSISSEKGRFEKQKLAILIDENSASASEIVAGAVQDNDRGVIIGRRSFGKGLVQEQTEFKDGSAIRLTIARYFTPSGRCIQKPYENGRIEDYYQDEMERYDTGELVNADSVKLNKKLKYTTPAGKVVYGGGGIMPDYFIPIDTTKVSRYISELLYKNLINDFALEYVNKNRAQLKYTNAKEFNQQFKVNTPLINELKSYANKNNIKSSASDLGKGLDLLSTHLKAYIAKDIFNQEAWFFVKNANDDACKKALLMLSKQKN
jgi:carboxyl-terminal processing protease